MSKPIYDLLEAIPAFTELKLRDAKLVVDYFLRDVSRTDVTRAELRAQSGANPLRVDPIIEELLSHRLVKSVVNEEQNLMIYEWVGRVL